METLLGSGLILSEPRWTTETSVNTHTSHTMMRKRNLIIQKTPLNNSVGGPVPLSTLIIFECIQKIFEKGSTVLELKNPKEGFPIPVSTLEPAKIILLKSFSKVIS